MPIILPAERLKQNSKFKACMAASTQQSHMNIYIAKHPCLCTQLKWCLEKCTALNAYTKTATKLDHLIPETHMAERELTPTQADPDHLDVHTHIKTSKVILKTKNVLILESNLKEVIF